MIDEQTWRSSLDIQIPRSATDKSWTVKDLREAVSVQAKPPPGAFWDFVFKRPVPVVQTCLQKVLARLRECCCNKRRSGTTCSSREPLLATSEQDLEGGPPKMESVDLLDDFRTLESYGIEADTTLEVYANSDGERIRAREEARQRARDEARQLFERQKARETCLSYTGAGSCCCLIFVLTQILPVILFNLQSFEADCIWGREHYYDLATLRGLVSDDMAPYHDTPFNETKEFWARVQQEASACGACLANYTEATAALEATTLREKGVGCCLPDLNVFEDQLGEGRPFSQGEWKTVPHGRRRRLHRVIWKPDPNGWERKYDTATAAMPGNDSCVDCLQTKEALAEDLWKCFREEAGIRLPTPRDPNLGWNRELVALRDLHGNESRWCHVTERARLLDEREIDSAETCSEWRCFSGMEVFFWDIGIGFLLACLCSGERR